jgi:hypothetical protein
MRAHPTDIAQQLEQVLGILLFSVVCVVVLGPRSGLLHACLNSLDETHNDGVEHADDGRTLP